MRLNFGNDKLSISKDDSIFSYPIPETTSSLSIDTSNHCESPPIKMRAVVQRVSQASVTGGGKTAEIGCGLLVLVGIEATDTERERDALITQLFRLKLFPAADSGKPWCAGVRDIENGGVLLVSQFTLNAVLKSGKPSFHRSMPPEPAKEMWGRIVEEAQKLHPEGVRSCVFGSWMDVHLVNDGKLAAIDRIFSFLKSI